MAIRQVTSRSINDGEIVAADIANTSITGAKLTAGAGGVGFFQGENGSRGDTTNGKGDIFRTHESTLNSNTTLGTHNAADNSLCAGPLTIATGTTLTISNSCTLVIA